MPGPLEQIGSRPMAGRAAGRKKAKRRTARKNRRMAKKLKEDAPKRPCYRGYYD